jgi:hypothetical protein
MHNVKTFGAGSGNRTGPPHTSLEHCVNLLGIGRYNFFDTTFGAAGAPRGIAGGRSPRAALTKA